MGRNPRRTGPARPFPVDGPASPEAGALDARPARSAPYTGAAAGTYSGDVVWTQVDQPSGNTFTDQAFEAVYAAYDSWGGDDFIVSWSGCTSVEIDSLFTPGSFTAG